MDKKKRYLRFGGIDVAKRKHVLCIIDRDGNRLFKSRSFANDQEGYQRLLQTLKNSSAGTSIMRFVMSSV